MEGWCMRVVHGGMAHERMVHGVVVHGGVVYERAMHEDGV